MKKFVVLLTLVLIIVGYKMCPAVDTSIAAPAHQTLITRTGPMSPVNGIEGRDSRRDRGPSLLFQEEALPLGSIARGTRCTGSVVSEVERAVLEKAVLLGASGESSIDKFILEMPSEKDQEPQWREVWRVNNNDASFSITVSFRSHRDGVTTFAVR